MGECHMNNHEKLCNGHGLCSIDPAPEINKARCFCNKGKMGRDCTLEYKEPPKPTNVTGILTAFVITLLVLLIALATLLYIKIKSLNSDQNPYGAFEDQSPVTAAQ